MQRPAPAPPKGFRKPIPLIVKLQALLINGPVLDEDGNKVCDLKAIEWDHQPAIQERVFDPEAGDTVPACNDPNYIVPMVKEGHDEKTNKRDKREIAKTKRLATEQEKFVSKLLSRECGEKRVKKNSIPSRGFPKRGKATR